MDQFDYQNKRVTVMGLGRFGGGAGVVRFLADRGARVTLSDRQTDAELASSLSKLDDVTIHAVKLGGHDEEDFRSADLIVANPAVHPDNRYLAIASEARIPITTEIGLFWRHNRGRVIAVTGTNGKSTTASLIHCILDETGHACRLGGNIGISLLPVVDQIQPEEIVVLELSSFQLYWLEQIRAAPCVSVVTSFHPNHLDWHSSIAHYRSAKQAIMRHQTNDDVAVLSAEDAELTEWPGSARRLWFGTSDVGEDGVAVTETEMIFRRGGDEDVLRPPARFQLPGRHNRRNLAAAACAAWATGIDPPEIRAAADQFRSLPHRLEFVAEVNGRCFYNDSISTTPESTIAALDSFDRPIVLMVGGYDKQLDLTALAQVIGQRVRSVILMGQTAAILFELLSDCDCECHHCESFELAFRKAVDVSRDGDIVMLSPACASYDWFANFEERGRQFVRLIESLPK